MTGLIVDTSVWSLALRKKERSESEERVVLRFAETIRELHLVLIGPIRQEILSGISSKEKYEELRTKLAVFSDHDLRTRDYELAAQFHNTCRKNGIQGSHTDYLICAVAHNNDFGIFTLDEDFSRYQKFIDIRIEPVRA